MVFTPPHFSDLQRIEILWARIKSEVGRQYLKNTSIEDVRSRLYEQFGSLEREEGRDAVFAIINHVDDVISKFVREISEDEGADGNRTKTDSDLELEL